MNEHFVTAEIGTNWNGDYYNLRKMVHKCAIAGVDAVKFQCLSEELIDRHCELDWYRHASLSEQNIGNIMSICVEYGISFYASVTYPDAARILAPFVDYYKIRVADSENEEIWESIISNIRIQRKNLGKNQKIIVSSTRPIPQKFYDKDPDTDIINLYCIPQYPTRLGEINFDMLKNPEFEGYSNHCTDVTALMKAVRHGAKYLEFHISNDLDSFAIDNKVSLSYTQMEEFMKWLRKS